MVGVTGPSPRAVVFRRGHCLPGVRGGAGAHHPPAPDHGRGTGIGPAHHPDRRPAARPLPGPGIPDRHVHHTGDPPRHHLYPLHGRSPGQRLGPRRPAERHRPGWADRPPGRGPQRTTGPGRAAGGDARLEHVPPRLLGIRSHRCRLRPLGHDLRLRRRRLLQSGVPGRAGPRHLLAAGHRRRVRPHRAGHQRLVAGRCAGPRQLLRHGSFRLRHVCPRDHVGTVERAEQHRVGQRRHLCLRGPGAVLPRRQGGTARFDVHGDRRIVAQRVPRLVVTTDRRGGPGLHGRGLHPSLHRQQRFVRGRRHPR